MATLQPMNIHPLTAYRQKQRPELRQDALAALLGVSKAAVSRWERGIRKPDADNARLIQRKLGIPVRKLRPDLAELVA